MREIKKGYEIETQKDGKKKYFPFCLIDGEKFYVKYIDGSISNSTYLSNYIRSSSDRWYSNHLHVALATLAIKLNEHLKSEEERENRKIVSKEIVYL